MISHLSVIRLLAGELIVLATAVVLLALEAFGVTRRPKLTCLMSLGLLGAGIACVLNWGTHLVLFGGAFSVDSLALYFKLLMLLITLLTTLVSTDWLDRRVERPAEFYAMMLFVCLGMMFMASAGDLLTIFIALELTSMPLYTLACSARHDRSSSEAGLKFFLLGALASGLYLMGAAMIFGSLGTIYLSQFAAALQQTGGFSHAFCFGLLCVLAAFGFKIAAAPFHMWAPDVYQGAPTPVAAFLSTGPKVAGVAILMRLLLGSLNFNAMQIHASVDWRLVISVLSVLSMTVGNLVAMHQTSLKRLMAYSSIAHMGYILVGLAAGSEQGAAAILFYIFLYTLTNLGVWGVIMVYGLDVGSDEIKDLAGMSQRAPGLALLLMLALLSLAGLPPLAGFVGKFYLFAAAWDKAPWLVAIALANSVASLYYYLGVLKVVYFRAPATDAPVRLSPPFQVGYCICILSIVVLGLFPPMSEWAFQVASTFFGRA